MSRERDTRAIHEDPDKSKTSSESSQSHNSGQQQTAKAQTYDMREDGGAVSSETPSFWQRTTQEWKDELQRMRRRGANWWRMLKGYRPPIGASPYSLIMQRNKMELRRYSLFDLKSEAVHPKIPVLIVPSTINRSYILDLQPGKSLVEYLIGQDLDVFMIDWGKPTSEDRYISFDDHVEHLLGAAIDNISRLTGHKQIHLIGHCLGGMLTLVYTALHPNRVCRLINLTSPVDLRHGGMLSTWAKFANPRLLINAFGNAPWPLLQLSFHTLKPMLFLQKTAWFYERLWDDHTVDNIIALETWANDNVSIAGQFFCTYIEEIYQKNALFDGTLVVKGRRVDLTTIHQPVLNVAAQGDHIAPEQSVMALAQLIPHTQNLLLRGGHIGAVISKYASQKLWPKISAFLSGDKEQI